MRLVAKEIRNLTAMCSAPLRGISDTIIAMNDTEEPGKYATMKRGKGRREAPDARKMYNEAFMVRKVKLLWSIKKKKRANNSSGFFY